MTDRTGQTGQDRTGQDRTGQDRTGQDRTGQDRTGQDRTGQDRTGQDRTGQDRTGQDRDGQDRTGQDKDRTSQDRTSQDRTRQDRASVVHTGGNSAKCFLYDRLEAFCLPCKRQTFPAGHPSKYLQSPSLLNFIDCEAPPLATMLSGAGMKVWWNHINF